MSDEYVKKILSICSEYNIPIKSLPEIITDPKVIPMIRGIGFEFFVYEKLTSKLDNSRWRVDKPILNAQINSHDVDVKVIDIKTNREISIECKLTGGGTSNNYRELDDGTHRISVKCMRSRTLGSEMVKKMAPIYGVSKRSLSIHADSYREDSFDFVATSLGNAFYRTDPKTKIPIWNPTEEEKKFLLKLFKQGNEDLKKCVFDHLYFSRSTDLIPGNNSVVCSRRMCNNKHCGFIPNYPNIIFNRDFTVKNKWIGIDEIELHFEKFIKNEIDFVDKKTIVKEPLSLFN